MIKQQYDKWFKYTSEKRVLEHNQSIDKLPIDKQNWYSKLLEHNPINTDFAKVMYNAFPEIRDSATQYKKGLDMYLENLGSNLLI